MTTRSDIAAVAATANEALLRARQAQGTEGGPVTLAGAVTGPSGSNAIVLTANASISGTLAAANQAPQTLGGVLGGTTAAATITALPVADLAPGTNGQILGTEAGAATWETATGTGAPVRTALPSIASPTLTGTATVSTLAGAGGALPISASQLQIATAGFGLSIKTGATGKIGVANLSGGTVMVANAGVTANSLILLTPQIVSGTLGIPSVAISPGVGFTINSTAVGDNSTMGYVILEIIP